MPVSKNYDLRKKILDRLIVKGKYSKTDLLDKLNDELAMDEYEIISKRQLGYDISAMKLEALRGKGELIFDRARGCYKYDPSDFSLTGIPINEEDIQVMTQALAILKQISGLRNTHELESIILRLGDKLGIKTDEIGEILVFDDVPGLKGIEHLNIILNKTIEKQPLFLRYKRYQEDPQNITMHPYFLKEFNGRWYIFGWNDDAQRIHNYALDRIEAVDDAYIPFNESHRVSPQEWLKDVVGVTRRDKEVEDVIFTIKKPRAYYVLTKPIHHSQEVIEDNEEYMVFKLRVIPNYELNAMFLSFGEDFIET